jgi:hypothetical protein
MDLQQDANIYYVVVVGAPISVIGVVACVSVEQNPVN